MSAITYCPRNGKVIYETAGAAERAARGANHRHNGKSGHSYRCEFCTGWHTTSSRFSHDRHKRIRDGQRKPGKEPR